MNTSQRKLFCACNNCKRDVRAPTLSFRAKEVTIPVVKCPCGLMYQNPRPPEDQLNEYYDSIYFSQSDKDFTGWRYFPKDMDREVMDTPNFTLFKRKGRFLDVGCGIGVTVAIMKDMGWDSWGIDISKYSTDFGKRKRGLNLITGNILEHRFEPDFFDTVYMRDVIEHLTRPKETLQEVHRIMSHGGLLVITTGNVDSLISKLRGPHWFYYQVDHIHYFSLTSLSNLLEAVGFEVIALGGEYFGGRTIPEVLENSNGKKLRVIDFLMTSKIGPMLYRNGFIGLANLLTPVLSVYARKFSS